MKGFIKVILCLSLILVIVTTSCPVYSPEPTEELSLELWFMPIWRPYMPDGERAAELIKDDLEAIGIDIDLETYDWGEYLDRTEEGEHDMALLGWTADIADPDNFMYSLLHGDNTIPPARNIAFYNNTFINTLLSDAREDFDQGNRSTIYEEACLQIHKDSPWFPIAHSENLAGALDTINGFMTHPTGPGGNVFANVSVSTGTELIISRDSDSVTLDPAEMTDEESWKVARQIYDGLYNFPAYSINPVPGLALYHNISVDRLTWNFTLRQGVKFHDGTDFNASAVVFSFERAENWDNTTSMYYTQGWVPPEAGYYDYIFGDLDLKVTELSTHEVQFTMNKPFAPFLSTLAMSVFSIVSPSYVMAHPGASSLDRLGINPCGTGPYMMFDWFWDDEIRLEKNSNFWGAINGEDELVFKVVTESATRIKELGAGDVHVVDNIPPIDAKTVEDMTGVNLMTQIGMDVGYMAMNSLKYPFNDNTVVPDPQFGGSTTRGTLVRRAFNYAINKANIINQVYSGRAFSAKNPIPPSFWGYNDDISEYQYNPDYAIEILQSLGFKAEHKPEESSSSTDSSESSIPSIGSGFQIFIILPVLFGIAVAFRRKK